MKMSIAAAARKHNIHLKAIKALLHRNPRRFGAEKLETGSKRGLWLLDDESQDFVDYVAWYHRDRTPPAEEEKKYFQGYYKRVTKPKREAQKRDSEQSEKLP